MQALEETKALTKRGWAASFFVREDQTYRFWQQTCQPKTTLARSFCLVLYLLPGLIVALAINIRPVFETELRLTHLSPRYLQLAWLLLVTFGWHMLSPFLLLRASDHLSVRQSLSFLGLDTGQRVRSTTSLPTQAQGGHYARFERIPVRCHRHHPRVHHEPPPDLRASKLEELAESIRQHGLIQPITIRPNASGFEIVAGARRFRAAQLAEIFSLPARIVELNDAQAMEWQLVENSQRVDVHPYEEAQGFQRLLDLPGYDVTALVEKSGKSASHIYARLSLLQLIPDVVKAFSEERITASHANLLARLPQEHQSAAFEECWRKDWQDKEPHLLPAKHLSAWIQANLYLNLAEAPFDREDTTLNPAAGACVTCPRRSGYNTSLFADVQGDQCKLCGIWATASLSRWLLADAVQPALHAIQPSVLLEPLPGGSFVRRLCSPPYTLGSLPIGRI